MILDEEIKRYFDNAEYERTHGNLQGCLEFKQLAKLLKELKAYRKICHKEHVDDCLRTDNEASSTNEVLDKMRAEIEKLQTYKMFVGEKTVYIERDDVLAIIDKHKAESEE
jgi:hypothetical protein